jgi:hypothetical protein
MLHMLPMKIKEKPILMTFPELVFMYENKKGIEKISIPLKKPFL